MLCSERSLCFVPSAGIHTLPWEDRQGFRDGHGHTSSTGDGLAQGWTPGQCHSWV